MRSDERPPVCSSSFEGTEGRYLHLPWGYIPTSESVRQLFDRIKRGID